MSPHRHLLTAAGLMVLAVVAACGDSGSLGGGGNEPGGGQAGVGGVNSFPAACPGYESTPGAGCPAPCEPLVEGGPDDRRYCTIGCLISPDCPAKHGCAKKTIDPSESEFVCLPGLCDSTEPTSCPDDMACNSPDSFCYPAPGTKADRCASYEAAAPEQCVGLCTDVMSLPGGGVWCTQTCENVPGEGCFAGESCFQGSAEMDLPIGPFCIAACITDNDCPPGVPCDTFAKLCVFY